MRLDDDLYREVKARAAREGRTVASVLEDAVRVGMRRPTDAEATPFVPLTFGSGGLPDMVLSGFLRLVTNRRVFAQPTPRADAWRFVDQLLEAPAAMSLQASERHWSHFRRLAHDIDARGSDIADAYLAAYAIDNNATFVSADRGFARFSRLKWRHPLDS